MTYAELQDAVLFNSFREGYRTIVARYLNEGVSDLCRRLELFAVQKVVATDASGVVELPQMFRVDAVFLADGAATEDPQLVRTQTRYQLQPMGLRQAAMDVMTPGGGTESAAYRVTTVASATGVATRIETFPSAGFIAVTGLEKPTAMSLDADTSGLSPELDGALIAYARMRAFQAEDDMALAGQWGGEYERALRNVAIQRIPSDAPIVTPGDHWLL